jgi:hypothetical protein
MQPDVIICELSYRLKAQTIIRYINSLVQVIIYYREVVGYIGAKERSLCQAGQQKPSSGTVSCI